MKPWGPALARLADGEVPYWRDTDVADPPPPGYTFASRTLVLATDASRLFGTPFDEGEHDQFTFAEPICKDDAAEILNADQVQIGRVIAGGHLSFEAARSRGSGPVEPPCSRSPPARLRRPSSRSC